MQAALNAEFLTVEDYLAGEQSSEIKHEYIAGVVYAMAGVTKQHNLISLNICEALRRHLRGGPCNVFVADVKVRLKVEEQHLFYYPDVMVGCDSRDTDSLYLRYPKILVEVSSESTERVDRQEKRSAYQNIETLEEYLIVSQDRLEVTLFCRANNWSPELLNRMDQSVNLKSVDLSLPLSSIYEAVVLTSR